MIKRIPVFIVEDSPTVRTALRELLGTVAFLSVVGEAATETQATEWLHKHRRGWCLAVIDLLLPEGSGFGLVQRCRSENPHATVIVFSEFATPAIKAKCIETGADAVFKKSELAELLQFLEGLTPCEAVA